MQVRVTVGGTALGRELLQSVTNISRVEVCQNRVSIFRNVCEFLVTACSLVWRRPVFGLNLKFWSAFARAVYFATWSIQWSFPHASHLSTCQVYAVRGSARAVLGLASKQAM